MVYTTAARDTYFDVFMFIHNIIIKSANNYRLNYFALRVNSFNLHFLKWICIQVYVLYINITFLHRINQFRIFKLSFTNQMLSRFLVSFE